MATAAPLESPFKVWVTFEGRSDGGLRAYCEDVPGFVLSNPNCDMVLSGVEPTLEVILSEMVGTRVKVSMLHELHEIRNGLQDMGIIPDRRGTKREYVALPEHA